MDRDTLTLLHHLTEAVESLCDIAAKLDSGCCMPSEQIRSELETAASNVVYALLLTTAQAADSPAALDLARKVTALAEDRT